MSSVVAIVKSIVGQVIALTPEGAQRVLIEGDRLFKGEQIATGPSGMVSLELADGRIVDLGRDTQWSSAELDAQTPATEPSASPSADELQQAIAAGVDPTQAFAPTAAGPGAGSSGGSVGGGHSFVMLETTASQLQAEIGFDTQLLALADTGTEVIQDPQTPNLPPAFSAADGSPLAGSLNLVTAEDTPLSGTFTARDPNGDPYTFSLTQAPTNGSLTLNADGTWQYSPNQDYNGPDSFAVLVIDGLGASSPLTVNLGVTAVNDAPVASGSYATDIVDSAVADSYADITGQLAATDVDDSTLTWSGSAAGSYGQLTVNPDGSYTYIVDAAAVNALQAGDQPSDSFTVTVTDPSGATDTRVITLNVTGTNDAPIAEGSSAAATEDNGLASGQLLASDVDNGDVLSYSLNGTAPAGFSLNAATGTWTLDTGNAAYQNLAEGATLSLDVPFTVTDSNGATSTSVLQLTVTGTNDAPIAEGSSAAATEDNGLASGQLLASDVDNGDVLSYSLNGTAPAGFSLNAATGTWTLDTGNAAYQNLAAGQTLSLDVPFTVTDSNGATSTSVLQLTVTGTNDAPIAEGSSAAATEDNGLASGQLLASDVDNGDVLSYSLNGTAPAGFSLNAATGTWTLDTGNAAYQNLAAGQTLSLDVPFTVTDSNGATSTSVLQLTVTGTNDAPIAEGSSAAATEDNGLASGQLLASDVDNGDVLSYSLNGTAPAGFSLNAATGTWTLDTGNVAYQNLAAGQTLSLDVPFTVTDSNGATSTSVLQLTVTGTNDAPIAEGSSAAATEDNGLASGQLLASDVDNGDVLSYSLNGTAPAGFSLDAATGTWTLDTGNAAYQNLAEGATLSLDVPFTVTDSNGATSTSVLQLTVTGTNDAPIAEGSSAAATEDNGLASGQLLASDVDNGDVLSYSLNGTAPAGFSLNAATGIWTLDTGNVAYQNLAAGQTLSLDVPFTVTDSNGATDTRVITLNVTGTNDAPIAEDSSAAATEDSGLASGQLLASDVDNGDVLSYSLNGTAPAGFSLNAATGTWTLDTGNAAYQNLAEGATLSLDVPFTVTDSNGATSTSVLQLTVTGTNDAPVAQAATAFAVEDGLSNAGAVGNATDGSAIVITVVTTDANQAFSFDWQFKAGDYLPFNDFAFVQINGQPAGTLSSVAMVGNYGDSGLQTYAYTFGAPGTYQIVIGIADSGDTGVDSQLNLSNLSNGLISSITSTGAATNNGGAWTLVSSGTNPQGLIDLVSKPAQIGGQLQASDADTGASLTFSLPGSAPAGFALNSDGSWTFDSSNAAYQSLAQGELKVISITYTVSDEHNASSQSTLTINLTGTNDAPVASASSAAVSEDGTINGTLLGSDVDNGASLSFGLVGNAPAGFSLSSTGTWTFNAGDAAYQHLGAGVPLTVSVPYTVTDEHGASSQSTLTLTVTGVNDAAILSNADVALDETDALLTTGGQLTISDIDSPTTFVAQTGNAGAYGSFSVDTDGNWSYTANAAYNELNVGQSHQDSFEVFSADGTKTTVTVTIDGTNDAPVASAVVASGSEDPSTRIPVTLAGSDVDGNVSSYTLDSLPANGSLYSSASGGTPLSVGAVVSGPVYFVPDSNWNGDTSFQFSATDNSGATSASNTATISVAAVNDAPLASPASDSAVEDGPAVGGQLIASDVDSGDTLSFALTGNPPAGFALSSTGAWTLDPTHAAYQSLSEGVPLTIEVPYRVTDSGGLTSDSILTLTITGLNDTPVVSASITLGTDEDQSAQLIDLLANASDADTNDSLSVGNLTETSGNNASGVTFNAATGSLSVNPAAYNYLAVGESVTLIYSYEVSDGKGGSVATSATITIDGRNDAPAISSAIAVTRDEDASGFSVDLLANAGDADLSDSLSISGLSETSGNNAAGVTVSGATLSVDPTAYNYLAENESVTLTYDYTVIDGNGGVTPTTATLTIEGRNDAPVMLASIGNDAGIVVKAQAAANHSFASAISLDGAFVTGSNPDVQNAETTPFVSIHGTGGNAADYYAFTVTEAGTTAVFDIDYGITNSGGFDSYLHLWDANGNRIALNDDNSTQNGAGGSVNGLDAYLSYTFSQPGTYYISVGKYPGSATPNNPIPAGATYQLQVSLDKAITNGTAGAVDERADGVNGENSGNLTASGELAFSDADLSNSHSASAQLLSATDSVSGASSALGSLTPVISNAATGDGKGIVTWNFSVAASALDFLGAGQTLTQVYRVSVTDSSGASAFKDVTVTLTGSNDAPLVSGAVASVSHEDALAYSVDLLQNAADVDAIDAISVSNLQEISGNDAAGVTVNPDGTLSVDPSRYNYLAVGENVTLTYSYNVIDGKGGVTPTTTTLTIEGRNDLPVVSSTSATVAEESTGTNLNIAAPTDVDGDSLTITVTGLPTLGSVTLADGTAVNNGQILTSEQLQGLKYNGPADYNAGQTVGNFTYSVYDGSATVSGSVTLGVTPVNDDPVANNDFGVVSGLTGKYYGYSQGTDGNNLESLSNVTAFIASHAPSATFIATSVNYGNGVGSDLGGQQQLQQFLGGDAASLNTDPANTSDAIIQLTGALNLAAGTYQFQVTADDGYSIRVDGVVVAEYNGNQGPTARESATFNIAESGAHQIEIIYWDQGDQAVLKVELRPENGSYSVLGGTALSHTVGSELVTNEDQALTISPATLLGNDSDVDGDSLTITSVQGAVNGSVALVNGNVVFTPASNFNGTGSFTYTISDGQGGGSTATATVGVNALNDAPVAASASAGTGENGVLNSTVPTASDIDSAINTNAYALVSGPGTGNGSLIFNSDGSYSFNPGSDFDSLAAGDTRPVTFTYTAQDSNGAVSAPATITITVTGSNDAAVVSSASVTLSETNAPLSTGGQLTISDVDGPDTFLAQTNAPGTYGSFSIDAAGNWSYSANSALDTLSIGQSAIENFTVFAADGTSTTVQVTINGSNDAAVLSSAVIDLSETNAPLTTGGLLTISDVDNPNSFLAQTNTPGNHGNFSIDAAGNWSYIASTALDNLNIGQSVSENFTVLAADGTSTTVQVTIHGSNDAAILSSAVIDLNETDAPLTTSGQLSIVDVDSPAEFIAQSAFQGIYGSFSIDASGSWSFTADSAFEQLSAGQTIVDTFSVAAADGTTTSVQVTITGTNDVPVATSTSASVMEDDAELNGQLAATDADGSAVLSFTLNQAAPAGFSLNSSGSWTFDPSDAAYQALKVGESQVINIPFTVTDDKGTTSNSSLTLTVSGSNDAPIAAPASAGAVEDGVFTPGPVANSIDGSAIVITVVVTEPNQSFDFNWQFSTSDYLPYNDFAFIQIDGQPVQTLSSISAVGNNGNSGLQNFSHVFATPGTYQIVIGVADALDGVGDSNLALSNLPSALIGSITTVGAASGANGSWNLSSNGANNGTLSNLLTPVTQVSGQLQASDVDHNAVLTFSVDGTPPAGFSLNPNGSWTFDSSDAAYQSLGQGQTQIIPIPFTVTDEHGASSGSILTLTVTGINDKPLISAATGAASEGAAVISGQIAGSDVDTGAVLTYSTTANVAGLTLSSAGVWSFDPSNPAYDSLALGQQQVISIPVTVTDQHNASSSSTLTITLTGTNDVPVASAGVGTTGENTTLNSSVPAATDVDGTVASYTLATGVGNGNGTLTFNANGTYSFNPGSDFDNLAAGASRQVSFSYTATDNNGGISAPATVTITVNGVNDAPAGTNNAVSLNEDTSRVFTAGDFGFTDVDAGDSLKAVRIDSLPGAGSLTLGGVAVTAGQVITVAQIGSLTFTPAANANGNNYASLTFSVQDQSNAFDTTPNTLTLNVTPVNDAPVANNDVNLSGLKGEYFAYREGTDGGNLTNLSGVTAFINSHTASATFVGKTLNYGLVPDGGLGGDQKLQQFLKGDAASLSGDPANSSDAIIKLSGLVNLDAGTYQFRVTADDGFTIRIDGVAVAEFDGNQSPTTREFATFNISQSGQHQIEIIYWDQTGNAQLQVELRNQGGTYSVLGEDKLSQLNPALITNEDQALTINPSILLANDTDIDGDTLSITSVQDAQHGSVALVNGNVVFTPTLNYSGQASFTYTINDGHGGLDTATVNLTVNPANDVPVAFADSLSASEDTPVSFSAAQLTGNDSDTENSPLTIASVTSGNNGTAVLDANGNVRFTPNANFNGVADFSYTVTDGSLTSNTASVTVNVGAVNDAPANTLPASYTVNEDTPLKLSGMSVTDVDAASGAISVTLAVVSGTITAAVAAGITVTGSGTGSVVLSGTLTEINAYLAAPATQPTYTPVANASGTVTLTMTTNDLGNTGAGGALNDIDTTAITINPVADAVPGSDVSVVIGSPVTNTISFVDNGNLNGLPSYTFGNGITISTGGNGVFAWSNGNDLGVNGSGDNGGAAQRIEGNEAIGFTFPYGMQYMALKLKNAGDDTVLVRSTLEVGDLQVNQPITGTITSSGGTVSSFNLKVSLVLDVLNGGTTSTVTLNATVNSGGTWSVSYSGVSGTITKATVVSTIDGDLFNQGGNTLANVTYSTSSDMQSLSIAQDTSNTFSSGQNNNGFQIEYIAVDPSPSGLTSYSYPVDLYAVIQDTVGTVETFTSLKLSELPVGSIISVVRADGTYQEIAPNALGEYDLSTYTSLLSTATTSAGTDKIYLTTNSALPSGFAPTLTLEVSDGGSSTAKTIIGGSGDSTLTGGSGNDYISGGAGSDNISGAVGNDTLAGGTGNDTLIGGSGDDILLGGTGTDQLSGEMGADSFVWRAGDVGSDVIKDFSATDGDRINLSDLLQGESDGNILNYLQVDTATNTLQVSTTGSFATGASADLTIQLQGIDLTTYGSSSAQIVNSLIAGADPLVKVDHS